MLKWLFSHFASNLARFGKYFVPPSLRPAVREKYIYTIRSLADWVEHRRLREHKTKGGNYLTWYAKRLDDGYIHATDIQNALPRKDLLDSGKDDLDVAISLGLGAQHRLHEFGCGFLRATHHFVRYLEPGKYSANDASAQHMEHGRMAVSKYYGEDLFSVRKPIFVVNRDNTFDWLDGEKVDYIWCGAVLPHMPEPDIEEFFDNVKKAMHGETVFLFTYSGADIAGFRPFAAIADLDVRIERATRFARDHNRLHVIRALERNSGHDSIRVSVKDWFHTPRFYESVITQREMTFEDVSHALPIEHCVSFPMWVRLGKVTLRKG